MKTKSYTLHCTNGRLRISETEEKDSIGLTILDASNTLVLDHDEWEELCGMRYELTCNKNYPLDQVPDLTPSATEEPDEPPLELPTADATIDKLRNEEL